MEMEAENKKVSDVLHRSREQRYFFDRIFNLNQSTQEVYEKTC
jgi:kinesin family protein 18/19